MIMHALSQETVRVMQDVVNKYLQDWYETWYAVANMTKEGLIHAEARVTVPTKKCDYSL